MSHFIFCDFSKMENNENSHKIVMLGTSGVGKTSILQQLQDHVFKRIVAPTVGSGVIVKEIKTRAGSVSLRIWDTAGEELYRAFTGLYSRSAVAGIIVFDVTDIVSFKELPTWINVFKQNAIDNAILYLAGNKTDLYDRRTIDKEAAEQFACNNNMKYFEVSAKTGENIELMFNELATELGPTIINYETVEKIVSISEQKDESSCC